MRLQEITHMGTFKYSIDRAALMGAANDVKWSPRVGIGSGAARKFPAHPGVYVFAEDAAAGVDVRYVGRTGDLQRRIGDHIMYSNNDCLRNVLDNAANVKISVTVQGSRTARMNIEIPATSTILATTTPCVTMPNPRGAIWEECRCRSSPL